MIPVLIESALRALLVAMTVGAGLRLFRVSNVPAQKAAWGLVLVCAVAMPALLRVAMRWQDLPASMAFKVPVPLTAACGRIVAHSRLPCCCLHMQMDW